MHQFDYMHIFTTVSAHHAVDDWSEVDLYKHGVLLSIYSAWLSYWEVGNPTPQSLYMNSA